VDEKLRDKYTAKSTALYDRLSELCAVMDAGRAAANVPTYNGGLFRSAAASDEAADEREIAVARFLAEHKVGDFYLASAIDRLARVEDKRTFSLSVSAVPSRRWKRTRGIWTRPASPIWMTGDGGPTSTPCGTAMARCWPRAAWHAGGDDGNAALGHAADDERVHRSSHL
jgi:hypothetical protein